MSGFSGRAYAGTLLAYLVLRSDILLLSGMRGPEATGLYAVAVRPVDFLLLLPAVAGTLLFPRIAASGDRDSARFTATVARHAALFMLVACTVLAAVAWWAMPLLFGPEYRASVPALWILLPGVWCMAVQGIVANDLGGRDYPLAVLGIWIALFATNLGLNVWWIPKFGIAGAAASSSIAYGLALVLMARYWLRRFPEICLAELLVVKPGELRSLFDRLKRALLPVRTRSDASTPDAGPA